MNELWHQQHILGKNSSLPQRINWHILHSNHCACRAIPTSIAAIIKGKKIKTCSRGHKYIKENVCPICWPGHNK